MDMPPIEEVVPAVAEDVAEDVAEESDEDMEDPIAIVIVVVRPLTVSVMTSSVTVVSFPLTDSVVVIIDILETWLARF
ncbi:hypothetical protein E6O75_ATG02059 [Venturia nashicola]|uniref:Uncharacterized protein n=1 Tax=Venturia nashicola TaxID=86259 RepID=A0A4Z1P4I2_9PEZI|nr:hypothetical protein E6O75_ATG02059 [Venturia nashicola]